MKWYVPPEVKACGPNAVKHFCKVRDMGYDEKWAIMVATQTPPGTKGTDRAFQEGRLDGNWLDSLPLRQAKRIVREAKAAGIDISGKQYVSGLADKRGHMDPEAWVSDTADVKRVAKKRNLTVQGIVQHQGYEPPPKQVAINPRLEKRLIAEEMRSRPGMSREAARELVRGKYAPQWKRKK